MADEKSLEEKVEEGQDSVKANDEFTDPQYIKSQFWGHGLGAILSTAGTFGLESLLGLGTGTIGATAGLSLAAEGLDYAGDQTGFNTARYFYERKKERYKGFFGKFRYLYDSLGYAVKHIGGEVVGRVLGFTATFGIAYLTGLPVYLALLAPRAVEIGANIITNYYGTKKYRQELGEKSAQPAINAKPGYAPV